MAVIFVSLSILGAGEVLLAQHDLVFSRLATTWDEGLPLGNGMLGALVWQKDGRLRLSLDRADLWDLRPMPNLDAPEWSFRWVEEKWRKNQYRDVQEKFDAPYETSPAPTKIPAGALEFDLAGFGEAEGARLSVDEAVCRVTWPEGKSFECFVHAEKPCGRFRFNGAPENLRPVLVAPAYGAPPTRGADSVTGQDLSRLGYVQGKITETPGLIVYRQPGWDGFYYEIAVAWRGDGHGTIDGAWSISSKFSEDRKEPPAAVAARQELAQDFEASRAAHARWWRAFWAKSGIDLPDKVLEKQWYLEQYKFGSAARRGAPPISLQAVWTADNGKLPPWKGDFHHDLNTELSYWPCYSGNHLEEGLGFLDWLWELRPGFDTIHASLLRDSRPRCSGRQHASRTADGRLGPVQLLPDHRRLAGPTLRPALALQPGPAVPRRAGLSLGPGGRGLPGRVFGAGREREAPPAAEL